MLKLPFQNRTEAGRLLGEKLASRDLGCNPIVLALVRGGLPVAAEVADVLNVPLDIVVVRKLGVPWEPELAMGAVAGGTRVLYHQLIHSLRISPDEVEVVAARETEEMQRREELCRCGLPPAGLHDRTVLLVDDGMATGARMSAAVEHVRDALARK